MSPPQTDSSLPAYRRLKLVVSTPEHQNTSTPLVQSNNEIVKDRSSRSSSPTRPSYSPVTPTLSHSSAAGQDAADPEWIEEPEPLPVSLSENPDAIALRATLSLLQMQRQQSLRDIRGLDKLRQEALEYPEAFVQDLREGKLSKPTPTGIDLDPDLDKSDEDGSSPQQRQSRFGKLPVGQNIARCPPIEWAKYHVVGEQLDRLHEQQRRYPGITDEALARGSQPRAHEIMAPYRPFSDKLNPLAPSSGARNYDK